MVEAQLTRPPLRCPCLQMHHSNGIGAEVGYDVSGDIGVGERAGEGNVRGTMMWYEADQGCS